MSTINFSFPHLCSFHIYFCFMIASLYAGCILWFVHISSVLTWSLSYQIVWYSATKNRKAKTQYRVVQKSENRSRFASDFVKSYPICQILSLRERGRNFQCELQNIFCHTLNVLLHYLLKLLIRSNLMEIWKKMETKCIDFACTEYNLSSLITSLLLTYLLFHFLVPVKYSLKLQIFYLNRTKCWQLHLHIEHASLYNFSSSQRPFYYYYYYF